MTEPTGTLERRNAATDRATIVVVPRRRLFAIDGVGGPTAADFRLGVREQETLGKFQLSDAGPERSHRRRHIDRGGSAKRHGWKSGFGHRT